MNFIEWMNEWMNEWMKKNESFHSINPPNRPLSLTNKPHCRVNAYDTGLTSYIFLLLASSACAHYMAQILWMDETRIAFSWHKWAVPVDKSVSPSNKSVHCWWHCVPQFWQWRPRGMGKEICVAIISLRFWLCPFFLWLRPMDTPTAAT